MLIVHQKYPRDPMHFAKTAEEARTPGACHGQEVRWGAMQEGDVVTCVGTGDVRLYYFDPEYRVAGTRYVKVLEGGARWVCVGRSA